MYFIRSNTTKPVGEIPVRSSASVELMGIFNSEDDARSAAKQYGIEFKDFEEGVAVFIIDDGRSASDIIEEGKKNGWPELAVNGISGTY